MRDSTTDSQKSNPAAKTAQFLAPRAPGQIKNQTNQQLMIHVKPTAHNLKALETGAKRRGWEGAKAIAAAGVIRLFGQRPGSMKIEQIAAFQRLEETRHENRTNHFEHDRCSPRNREPGPQRRRNGFRNRAGAGAARRPEN